MLVRLDLSLLQIWFIIMIKQQRRVGRHGSEKTGRSWHTSCGGRGVGIGVAAMEINYEVRFESFEDLYFYICREIERMESGEMSLREWWTLALMSG